jgi:hypothetical protein
MEICRVAALAGITKPDGGVAIRVIKRELSDVFQAYSAQIRSRMQASKSDRNLGPGSAMSKFSMMKCDEGICSSRRIAAAFHAVLVDHRAWQRQGFWRIARTVGTES